MYQLDDSKWKKIMKNYKNIMICFTVLLTACQTGLDPQKTEQPPRFKVLAKIDTNNIFQDGNNQHQVAGKNVLLKLDHSCQLDQKFNYSNNQSVTYRYIFKNEKLISATTIMPDHRNTEYMQSIWDDPKDAAIKEKFEQAKESFSKETLQKCK